MRALAIAAVAWLASAGAEAACLPHDPACFSFGAPGHVFGTDRFTPRERAGSDLYINRTAPPAASPAPRIRFDPYGRMILAPAARRPSRVEDTDLAEEGDEVPGILRPRIGNIPQGPANSPQGVADAPQGPADAPQQADNGS